MDRSNKLLGADHILGITWAELSLREITDPFYDDRNHHGQEPLSWMEPEKKENCAMKLIFLPWNGSFLSQVCLLIFLLALTVLLSALFLSSCRSLLLFFLPLLLPSCHASYRGYLMMSLNSSWWPLLNRDTYLLVFQNHWNTSILFLYVFLDKIAGTKQIQF